MAELRGQADGTPSDPRLLRESFGLLLASIGVDASPRAMEGVFQHWGEVVGDQVAVHARPVSLRHGRLLVLADHSVWASQLRYLGPVLLERLREFVGETVAEELVVRVEGTGSSRQSLNRRGGPR
jgi:predicted nucleic acid-binding Zn ribbon protein